MTSFISMTQSQVHFTFSTEVSALSQLIAAAGDLATCLQKVSPSSCLVALNGPMGAGKTTFVQAFAKAWGVKEPVTSPTFVLIHQYTSSNGMPLVHADLYRLGEQADSLLDELLDIIEGKNTLVLVEWAHLSPALMAMVDVVLHLSVSEIAQRKLTCLVYKEPWITAIQQFSFKEVWCG